MDAVSTSSIISIENGPGLNCWVDRLIGVVDLVAPFVSPERSCPDFLPWPETSPNFQPRKFWEIHQMPGKIGAEISNSSVLGGSFHGKETSPLKWPNNSGLDCHVNPGHTRPSSARCVQTCKWSANDVCKRSGSWSLVIWLWLSKIQSCGSRNFNDFWS